MSREDLRKTRKIKGRFFDFVTGNFLYSIYKKADKPEREILKYTKGSENFDPMLYLQYYSSKHNPGYRYCNRTGI
jgi:hypothetical protein